ncbi:MAG: phosphoenolpyruvate synthase [Chlamydiae bacterium RIFCSPLOWO2_01_FULL_28_7]|nr:MAG: phosphoenolpyruvate synthase [Chlamydiae bacterium RIFCSPLOWO2_01_FULL_28_7]
MKFTKFYKDISINDVPIFGGKNASLGEMYQNLKKENIDIPNGFATSSEAYYFFLEKNNLKEKISEIIKNYQNNTIKLHIAGKKIRTLILKSFIPKELEEEIISSYKILSKEFNRDCIDVAIRSSATAEDLPDASFAGQQESFLNVSNEKDILKKCIKCFASLFTDRAISYREEKKFDHMKVALSIGIQKMVRSDKASSGVIFTLDTETGFKNVIQINASFGLGENIVQGLVEPDEFITFKPLLFNNNLRPIIQKKMGSKEKKMIYSYFGTKNINSSKKEKNSFSLNDDEILTLSRWAFLIEKYYKKPMDIEWAKDGIENKLYIVQARPETVQSSKKKDFFSNFSLKTKSKILTQGLAIGEAIVSGKVLVIKDLKDIEKFKEGYILVTKNTSPDWVPIMKKAKAIITDHGGRTSHAAIVSRELNVPAIVGTKNATSVLKNNDEVTVSCCEGETGYIYEGLLSFAKEEINLEKLPKIDTKIMINVASPECVFHWWHLPIDGIGLARMEFIINNIIKIHPMALYHFEKIKDKKTREIIEEITKEKDKKEFFIDELAINIAKIASLCYPKDVIVRMSDFKTNEYANLIGGKTFEFIEENPMLGFRGASRYYNPKYKDGFSLECKAVRKAREHIGLDNIIIMIPFLRTVEEAEKVINLLSSLGLKKGENNLKIYMMAEIPSNIILADKFNKFFDGYSVGSNDLTQLTLGIDRDSQELSELFDENNDAVKILIQELIQKAHKDKKKVGICGQAPSDKMDFGKFLIY